MIINNETKSIKFLLSVSRIVSKTDCLAVKSSAFSRRNLHRNWIDLLDTEIGLENQWHSGSVGSKRGRVERETGFLPRVSAFKVMFEARRRGILNEEIMTGLLFSSFFRDIQTFSSAAQRATRGFLQMSVLKRWQIEAQPLAAGESRPYQLEMLSLWRPQPVSKTSRRHFMEGYHGDAFSKSQSLGCRGKSACIIMAMTFSKRLSWDGLSLNLTHLPLDKMAAISQTTFSNAFSRMKMLKFRFNFHWNWFIRVQLIINQHWFR